MTFVIQDYSYYINMHIRVLNLHNNLPVNVKQPSICLHQLLKIVVVRFEIYFFFVLLPIVTILLWICMASDVSLAIFTQYHPTRPFRRAYDSVFFFISYFYLYLHIFDSDNQFIQCTEAFFFQIYLIKGAQTQTYESQKCISILKIFYI